MRHEFISRIPKAELNIHLEGSIEPELMFDLALRNGVRLRYPSPERLREAYNFRNLQSFLDAYYEGLSVLCDERDFYDATFSYLQKAALENVRHAEISFDPQAHLSRNVPMSSVVNGISRACEEAAREFDMTTRLILCFLRHLSPREAMDTLDEALPYRERIAAVGLDSTELGQPPVKFREVFARAEEEGFECVAHAGEEGPPEYIWQALHDLNVSRIDHALRCMEDPRLVEELVERQIPITVCPLANVKMRMVRQLEEHPLKRMLAAGLCVSVNSGDPAYAGGYINRNYIAASDSLGLTHNEIVQIARNSFRAAFLPEEESSFYLIRLEHFLRGWEEKHPSQAAA